MQCCLKMQLVLNVSWNSEHIKSYQWQQGTWTHAQWYMYSTCTVAWPTFVVALLIESGNFLELLVTNIALSRLYFHDCKVFKKSWNHSQAIKESLCTLNGLCCADLCIILYYTCYKLCIFRVGIIEWVKNTKPLKSFLEDELADNEKKRLQ